jgi:hypothetical protein
MLIVLCCHLITAFQIPFLNAEEVHVVSHGPLESLDTGQDANLISPNVCLPPVGPIRIAHRLESTSFLCRWNTGAQYQEF